MFLHQTLSRHNLTSHYFCLFFLAIGLFFSCWAGNVTATELKQSELLYTKKTLDERIASLSASQGIEESVRTRVLKLYESAKNNLDSITTFKQRTDIFKRSITEAPVESKRLMKDTQQLKVQFSQQAQEDFNRISTEELEQRLILEKEKINNFDEQLKNVLNDQTLQNSRPPLIRTEIIAAQQDIDNSKRKLEALANSTADKKEIEAEQIYLKTLMDARAAELVFLEIESITNPTRLELLSTQAEWVNIQKDRKNMVVNAIEEVLAKRRQQEAKEAQSALSQAEKELTGKHLVIQTITRENIQLSQELQTVTDKIERLNGQKTNIETKTEEIDKEFKGAERKIALASLSPALGKILREQRQALSLDNQWATLVETIQKETAFTSLSLFKVEEKLKQLADIDTALTAIMDAQVPQTGVFIERMKIQAELRILVNNQKDLLNKLEAADKTYLKVLGDFDFARDNMARKAKEFTDYLDENLLWVPSSNPIDQSFALDVAKSMGLLVSPKNWFSLGKDSLNAFSKKPFTSTIGLLCFIALLLMHRQCKKWLEYSIKRVKKPLTDRFSYTFLALACYFILVLPFPFFFYSWGGLLNSYFQAGDFSKAIAVGFQSASVSLLAIEFFYRLFAENGVARIHFQWQKDSVLLLRRQIAWIRFVAIPTNFLVSITNASKELAHSDSLGRLALIISLIALSVFLFQILNPNKSLLKPFLTAHPGGWINRLRFVWYPAAVLSPLLFIVFAAAGYYLSAWELEQKLILTLRITFITILVHQMVLRWFTLVNREIAIENIRKKRKAAIESEKHTPPQGSDEPVLPLEEQLIDIPKINAQTTKLVNMFISMALIIGFWWIWGNILPAFSFLDHIVLWQHEVIVNNQPAMQPVTLVNLFLAIIYGVIASVSVANFSGLMEMLLFSKLMRVESGSRYAINQTAKYAMVTIATIIIANELGGSWSQVQWLVAALGVGLGFGLQEIFANLVSGIILLFERPIRVGDTVTIGQVTGKVSRIQIRATTIMDWDQKELVVPNKTFITTELVNWTLTDATTRVVIPVGIAYGSNIEKAHRVMLETVMSTPLVLKEPEPCVLFMEFGDSALNFSVRVFVSETGHRLPIIHDLHVRLEKALRENGIEIPFPQRDIHIRSMTAMPQPIENKDGQHAAELR